MISSDLVSIVIPFHDRFELLRQTVSSVVRQDYRPLEIILVNDASSASFIPDESWRSDGITLQLLDTPSSVGPGAAREIGRTAAQGAFVCYLDSDDLWHPEKVSRQVAAFRAHPEAGMCYCASCNFTADGGPGKIRKGSDRACNGFLPRVLYGRPWDTSACMWTRAAVDRIGAWYDGWCWEDYEYDVRAGCRGVQIIHVPELLCYYRNEKSAEQLSLQVGQDRNLRHRAMSTIRIARECLESGLKPHSEGALRIAYLLITLAHRLCILEERALAAECLQYAARCFGGIKRRMLGGLVALMGRFPLRGALYGLRGVRRIAAVWIPHHVKISRWEP